MKRREFITALGSAAATWPLVAGAQTPPAPVIGVLSSLSAADVITQKNFAAFHRGLNEAGFEEGRNVMIEYRWAAGDYSRLPALAADLVARRVALIIASGGTLPARAAKAATSTIPIVFTAGEDPVRTGLVSSLSHPGANITGASFFAGVLSAKQIETIHDLLPGITSVAMLVNPNNPDVKDEISDGEKGARTLGLSFHVLPARTETDLGRAFTSAKEARVDALVVSIDPFLTIARGRIAALALQHALPAISYTRLFVESGLLASYGSTPTQAYRQVGEYAARILKGAKPGDLPVVQATKLELVLNLKSAKALGLTISREIMLRADEVIE